MSLPRVECDSCQALLRLSKQLFVCGRCEYFVCFECASTQGRPHGLTEHMTFARTLAHGNAHWDLQRWPPARDERRAAADHERSATNRAKPRTQPRQHQRHSVGGKTNTSHLSITRNKLPYAHNSGSTTKGSRGSAATRSESSDLPARLEAAINAGRIKRQAVHTQRQKQRHEVHARRCGMLQDYRELVAEDSARRQHQASMFDSVRADQRMQEIRQRERVAARMLSVGVTPLRGLPTMTKGELALR